MIDVNSIIHIPDEAFDIDKNTAVMCLQDYKKQVGAFEFKKDNIYSIEFAKSVGTIINQFTLILQRKKPIFQIIEKNDIQIPIITLQGIQNNEEIKVGNQIQEVVYKTTEPLKNKEGKAIRKGSKLTEKELQEAGFDINALLQEEKLIEIKIVK